MDAKYYRFLYHPVAQGLCFSASVGAAKGADGTQLLVLGSDAKDDSNAIIPVSAKTDHLHLLILADLHPLTLGRAQKIYQTAKVDTILLPEDKLPFAVKEDTEICEVRQTHEQQLPGFFLKLYNTGEKTDGKLMIYIGSRGVSPDTYECVMNVKPCIPTMPCRLTVDAGHLNCEMHCLLGADVTQCKKHNHQKKGVFLDGHFLPGYADLSACLPELKQYLAKEWDTIRFAGLPMGGGKEANTDSLLDIGKAGFCRCFIGNINVAPETVKEIVAKDAFSTFAFTGEESGLCISGCYVKR